MHSPSQRHSSTDGCDTASPAYFGHKKEAVGVGDAHGPARSLLLLLRHLKHWALGLKLGQPLKLFLQHEILAQRQDGS